MSFFKVKILVTCGSSGGHIFPALSFLNTLKERDKNIDTLLILPQKCIKDEIEISENKINYVTMPSFKLSLDFKKIDAIFDFLKGSLESIFLLLKFQPDVVVGFGSLVSIPLVLSAWMFRINTLIHEQNVIPGKANRFLANLADKIAISFKETEEYLKKYQRKIILTGNPLRKELNRIDKNKALDFFGLDKDKFTILVMGGSQGSHRINQGFLRAVFGIEDKSTIQVIHLSGIRDYASIKKSYEDLRIKVSLFGFLKTIQYAYSSADLVVSRAGATTVAEIIFYGIPAILIPYPYAYQHQINNAVILEREGCAFIIKDEDLDKDILEDTIKSLMPDDAQLNKMRTSFRQLLKHDACGLLVDEVMSFLNS